MAPCWSWVCLIPGLVVGVAFVVFVKGFACGLFWDRWAFGFVVRVVLCSVLFVGCC